MVSCQVLFSGPPHKTLLGSRPMTKSKLYLILSPVLALAFIVFGVQKFGTENPIFGIIAEKSGITAFEPYIRVLVGVAEIVAGAFLLFARTRMTGAVLGLLLLIGAIGLHLSPWLGISVPVGGSGLFVITLIMLGVSAFNLNLLRKAGEKLLFIK